MIRRSGGDTPRSVTSSTASLSGTTRGKKIWTVEEDESLKNLVGQYGTGNWTLVAQSLPDRTGKQCRERWHNHLGSGIKKGDWSEEEDRIIITMQRHIGNQWAKITKMLPGRTDNAVKNRFHATERAKSRGKCDESLYNTALDDAYFEALKKQHADIDFDQLCAEHAKDVLQGTADMSSVDNARTSSITGSDASSTRGKVRNNNTLLTLGMEHSYLDEGDDDDDALSEEGDEEGNHDFPHGGVMNLADVGHLEGARDPENDHMNLMDIDIISFDSDDMNLDFGEDGGLHHNPDTRTAGVADSCCFSYFDWGCSSYYKNVFNPATDKRNNKVGLPSSAQQGSNKRPAVFKRESSNQSHASSHQSASGNFYSLPPAPTGPIEMHTMGSSIGSSVAAQMPLAPTAPLQINTQPVPMSSGSATTSPTHLAQQQQQQAQMMYGSLPIAPIGQPNMVPAGNALQYQQFLAHQQQQMHLQQQQQFMVAYQQAMTPQQQQQQFQQYQQAQQLQQLQHAQMQNQFLAQQQQQYHAQQQPQMLPGGAYPQQYSMHAQYAMLQPQPQQLGTGSSRPVSTSSFGSAASHSRPVSGSYTGNSYLA